MTLQQGRDIAKTVRVLAFAAERDGGDAEEVSISIWIFSLQEKVIERMPKYKYSNYNDVRRVPADFLSALSVCDDVRKVG